MKVLSQGSRRFSFVVLALGAMLALPLAAGDLWVPAPSRAFAMPVPADFDAARSAVLVVLPEVTGTFEYALEVQLLQAGRPAQLRRIEVQRVVGRAGEPLELDLTPYLPAALDAGRDYLHLRLIAAAAPLGLRFEYEARAAGSGAPVLTPELQKAQGQPFEQLRDDLGKLSSRVDDEVARLDGILIGLSEELQAVDGKTLSNKSEIEKNKGDIFDVNAKHELLKQAFDQKKSEYDTRLNELDGKTGLHKLDIEKNKTDIGDVKSKHELLKQDFDSKKAQYDLKLNELEGKTGSVDAKVDSTKDQLKIELASKELLGLTKEELKQLLASKGELEQTKQEVLKKAVDDKLVWDIKQTDFALEQHKGTMLSLKQSLLDEKALADTDEKKARLQQVVDSLDSELDSVNEMLEMQQFTLQALMEKQSQMMQTMSNILKAMSDTSQAIVQNLK